MKVADAHCDTLTKFNSNPFLTHEAHWSQAKFNAVGGLFQIFAIFTLPELSGSEATSYAFKHIGVFNRYKDEQIKHIKSGSDFEDDKINIVLSLEGAAPIQRDINYLHAFYNAGVRAMGLTWNHRNFLADGVDEEFGLTHFGKEVVLEMEKLGMIVDVSHLNVNGFADVNAITKRAFIASHSNARAITNHPRNLYDEQIIEIRNRGGFIGLNFYAPFLSDGIAEKNDLLRHTEHFLKLGCEDVLGFGADFDGIDQSPFADVMDYSEIYDLFKQELQLSDEQLEKIFWKNLTNFFKRELK